MKRKAQLAQKRAKHLRHALIRSVPCLSFMHVPPKDLEGAIIWGLIKHLSRFVRIPGARRVYYVDVATSERELATNYDGRLGLVQPYPNSGPAQPRAYYLVAACPQTNLVFLYRLKIGEADLQLCSKYFKLYVERGKFIAVASWHTQPLCFALGDPDLVNALRIGLAKTLTEAG